MDPSSQQHGGSDSLQGSGHSHEFQVPSRLQMAPVADAARLQWGELGNTWIQSATDSANTLVATNPTVKSLALAAEQWRSGLRSEAQQRLGGFKPPLQITNGLLAEDWDLLKRVGTQQGGSSLQLGSSFSMKRSASENSLESMNNAQGSRKHSKQSAWGWEGASSAGQWPTWGSPSLSAYAEAHASAMQAMTRRPPFGLLTATEQQGQDSEEQDRHARQQQRQAFFNTPHLLHPSRSQPGFPTIQTQTQYLPRVPTAPSLQELGETLNNQATRNLEAVRAALQSAQASIQETANNCQQNLQVLSNIFQQNLTSNGGPLGAALSNSRAMVTWSISNSNDPLGGALVPWQVSYLTRIHIHTHKIPQVGRASQPHAAVGSTW